MKKLLLTAICLCAASAAQATTVIDFESYADPSYFSKLTDSGATFLGVPTYAGDPNAADLFAISAFGQSSWGTNGPKILCPHTVTLYCGGDFQVTFAAPVDNLSFKFTGESTTAAITVQAYLNGALVGTSSVAGDGNPFTAQLVDLSGLGFIDKILITRPVNATTGVGYDDFRFDALPEPSTWAMMLLGFGAIGIALRRRRSPTAILSA